MRKSLPNQFFFTEEENSFRKEVREWAESEIGPLVDKIEKENWFPREIFNKMGEKGYMGVHHSKDAGGTEKGLSYEIIVAEEISAVNAGVDMGRMASTTLYGMPLERFATEEQKEKYLKPVVKGDKLGAIGITEPLVGSDTAGMTTKATFDKGNNEWIIDGEKRFITNGSVADYLCIFAITDPTLNSKRGMSAFIVESEWEGFNVIKNFELTGMRGARVAQFSMNNLRIPGDNLLGFEGQGFKILMDELDSERTAIAAEAVGYARPAFECAAEYSSERVQFGREIRRFEGVSFKIADMATKIEAARLLTLQAARMYDEGLPITLQASMAKDFATEMAVEVTNDALQILGGMGYTKDYPVERFWRDARLMKIGGGTTEILKFLLQREVYRALGI